MHRGPSRREFLSRAACAGAVLAAASPSPAAAGMYVSLNGSLVNKPGAPLSWPEFVRLAGRVGYGGVDVSLGAAQKDGVAATRALLAEAKVKPAIASLPLQAWAGPDEAAFEDGMRGLEQQVKFAAAIGLTRMMVVLSPGSPVPREERHAFIKRRLTRIAEVLAGSDVRLGLEFLGPLMFRTGARAPHQYIWTLPETVALAKEVGPTIGIVLDIWHWHHSGGTVQDILDAGKPRIVHIHVSDAQAQPPEEVRDNARLMPGEGIIDSVGFFRALQKIGYEDAISPEPLGRVPAEMSAEAGARLGLDTTRAVLQKAGITLLS